MAPRPYRPDHSLATAVRTGHLDWAIVAARDVQLDTGRPISLELALELLPLVIRERTADYGAWAVRWLARLLAEPRGVTLEQAGDVLDALVELPLEPARLATLQRSIGAGPGAPNPGLL